MDTQSSALPTQTTLEGLRGTVRARYGAVASSIAQGATSSSCCGPSAGAAACCGSASATHDPMLRAVIENYCIFAPRVTWMHCDYFAVRSSILFDCVAVYLAYAEDLVETETVRFRITDDGFTVRDEAGPCVARVALRWRDLPAFHEHLTARLLGLA